ncbi:MAG TPA: hypothetical protein VH599_18370 [Ktedonobacterales bacterium]|jgi:hypothetical protein
MSNTDINLKTILSLVGTLDDSAGEQTSRERFRKYLGENIKQIGQVRDYIEECLRTSGDQYSRALQDLVNHLGQLFGFTVTFGRYQGVQGQIGFDGLWVSPTGFHMVVEVKTTEVYSVKTATLLGYIDELISAKRIPDWEHALGLYVVGRPDPKVSQLENAIVGEKRTHQLRVISTDALLSLAEMMSQYGTHKDFLEVVRPSVPRIDPIVQLMSRLLTGPKPEEITEPEEAPAPPVAPAQKNVVYWLTPVTDDEKQTAEEVIQSLVGQEHVYAFGDRTPGRKHIKPGDWICFYATGTGVVGHARVASAPEYKPHPKVRSPEKYPWAFRVENVKLYLKQPVVIDAALRSSLDVFQGRDPSSPWAWFVQAARKLSERDFAQLTGQQENTKN